jgi:hypothetical protein
MTDTGDISTIAAEQYDNGNVSSSFIDVALGNGDIQQQQQQPPAAKTLHLRWTNILKSVETKDDVTNTLPHRGRSASLKSGSKITPNATKSTKVILDRVSGEARPGEILATMVRTILKCQDYQHYNLYQ